MADLDCTRCGTDEHVRLVERLTGSQRKVRCERCGREWVRGEPERRGADRPAVRTGRMGFPSASRVEPWRRDGAEELKAEFLRENPGPEDTAAFLTKYQHIFSAEGLPGADPEDLKSFATDRRGAWMGRQSTFDGAWNELGPEAAADRVRKAVDYLLRGPSPAAVEDRLTNLIEEKVPFAMKGLKEVYLTKVLCVVYPDEYLLVLKHTSEDSKFGRREIARSLWGLELPALSAGLVGRFTRAGNDLLIELCGDGFKNLQHATDFLWWAKDRARAVSCGR